ncbi:MAG: hypothetical protein ABIF82_14670 [Planctomycetota bacterium]
MAVGLIAAALALIAPLMAPIKRGSAAEFWKCACGVDLDPEFSDRYGVAYPPRNGWHVYWSCYSGGFNIHGPDYQRVTDADVEAALPEVVRRLEAAGEGELRSSMLSGYRAWARSPDREQTGAAGLLSQIRLAGLAERLEEDIDRYMYKLTDEACVVEVQRCAARYHVNIIFEFCHLSVVVFFAAWPWLWNKGRWAWSIHAALLPPLFHLPYFLGYCPLAMTSAGPVGGALYPILLVMSSVRGCATDLDEFVFEHLPNLLGPISQTPGPMLAITGGAVSPTASLGFGLALGSVTFAVCTARSCWRRRKTPRAN